MAMTDEEEKLLRSSVLRLEAELKKITDAKADASDAVAREGLGKLEGRLTAELEKFEKRLAELVKPSPTPAPVEKDGFWDDVDALLKWLGLK